MTGFLAGAALLLIIALAMLLRPLLRRDAAETPVVRAGINARIYRDQLAELEVDRANGIIDAANYAEARRELERRALDDIGEEAALPQPAARWPAIALVLVVPLAAILTYVALGRPAAMGDAPATEHAVTVERIQRMVADLAERMERNPDDLKGWVMLGRAYKAMDRMDDSIRAFGRAGKALDEDPQNLIDYAEAVALADKDNFQKRGVPLIERALKLDPEHIPALVFAGSAAFERGDFRGAARYWHKVLARLPPDTNEARAITEAIERAESAQAMGGQAGKQAGKSAAKPAAGKSDPRAGEGSSSAGLSGVVTLAPALAAKAGPEDTVFVFARAAEGPRAPLAVLRARVKDLPLKFSLNDSQAMSPELRLSLFAKVRVEARVSRSGNASPQSGDLQGASSIVAADTGNLSIVIDQLVP